MPVEETQTDELVLALRAIDSATLEAIADETGYAPRTLWRYRAGTTSPPAGGRRVLERALGLSSRRPRGGRDAD